MILPSVLPTDLCRSSLWGSISVPVVFVIVWGSSRSLSDVILTCLPLTSVTRLPPPLTLWTCPDDLGSLTSTGGRWRPFSCITCPLLKELEYYLETLRSRPLGFWRCLWSRPSLSTNLVIVPVLRLDIPRIFQTVPLWTSPRTGPCE